VKFFPAGTSGGAAAIKALAAPFGEVRFVPTGGVGPTNLAEYLSIPVVAAVGGSWMVPRDLVRSGDFAGIQALTADAVAMVGTLSATAR
jgi:2-dehydro-3-deoxyphosphogluconate aldolase/(4S)-4-hydroxy-2-oxoglutarate aldolase